MDRSATESVVPRSIIPGRQRWYAASLLSQPKAAALVEQRIGRSPGVVEVRANPTTGRVLIRHDGTLSSDEVRLLVLRAVRPVEHGQSRCSTALVIGGAATALALAAAPAVVGLGAVLAATALVLRRAWRRSKASTPDQGSEQAKAVRHPLLRIVGPHRKDLGAAAAFSALSQVMTTSFSMCIGWLGLVFFNGPSSALLGIGLTTVGAQLGFVAVVAALVYSAGSVFSYRAGITWRDLAQTVQHDWRHEMYAHVQRLELRHLEDERTTRISQILLADTDQFGRFLGSTANELVQLGASFATLLLVFAVFTPAIAWVVFLPVPLIAWMSVRHHHRVAPEYREIMEMRSRLASQLINDLEGNATIKSFCAEEHEAERIRELSADFRARHHRVDGDAVTYNEIIRGCVTASLGATLLAGGMAVTNGALAFEAFYPVFALPQQLLWKLPGLGNAISQYQQTVAALHRLLDLRALPVEPVDGGRRLALKQVRGELVLDRVSFSYPQRPPVLSEVSLRIAAGRITAVVGTSGAGKTTIAKLLMRFHHAGSGRVLLDGQDISELNLQDLRRAISFVTQDAFLFDGTIADNIGYGGFDADDGRVACSARLAEVDGFIDGLPLRYDTRTGERGVAFSGGQKQRIALARAIAKDAPVLVLDEATSALDNDTEAAVYRSLREFADGRTVLIIAHRLSTVRHADWIYVLGDGGAIVEQGAHRELVDRAGVYAALWRRQLGEPLS